MMKAKILKVLRKIKYDYRYGLFDLLRRRETRVWAPYTPSDLTKLAFCDGIHHDSLVMVSASHPVSEECAENLCPLEENHAISHMAVENLKKLFEASEDACGEKILFTSTYRTLAFQSSIYGVNPYAAKPGRVSIIQVLWRISRWKAMPSAVLSFPKRGNGCQSTLTSMDL